MNLSRKVKLLENNGLTVRNKTSCVFDNYFNHLLFVKAINYDYIQCTENVRIYYLSTPI